MDIEIFELIPINGFSYKDENLKRLIKEASPFRFERRTRKDLGRFQQEIYDNLASLKSALNIRILLNISDNVPIKEPIRLKVLYFPEIQEEIQLLPLNSEGLIGGKSVILKKEDLP